MGRGEVSSLIGDHGWNVNSPGDSQGDVIMHIQSTCSGGDSCERTATEGVYDSGNGACHRERGKPRRVKRDEERQLALGMQERKDKRRSKEQPGGAESFYHSSVQRLLHSRVQRLLSKYQ